MSAGGSVQASAGGSARASASGSARASASGSARATAPAAATKMISIMFGPKKAITVSVVHGVTTKIEIAQILAPLMGVAPFQVQLVSDGKLVRLCSSEIFDATPFDDVVHAVPLHIYDVADSKKPANTIDFVVDVSAVYRHAPFGDRVTLSVIPGALPTVSSVVAVLAYKAMLSHKLAELVYKTERKSTTSGRSARSHDVKIIGDIDTTEKFNPLDFQNGQIALVEKSALLVKTRTGSTIVIPIKTGKTTNADIAHFIANETGIALPMIRLIYEGKGVPNLFSNELYNESQFKEHSPSLFPLRASEAVYDLSQDAPPIGAVNFSIVLPAADDGSSAERVVRFAAVPNSAKLSELANAVARKLRVSSKLVQIVLEYNDRAPGASGRRMITDNTAEGTFDPRDFRQIFGRFKLVVPPGGISSGEEGKEYDEDSDPRVVLTQLIEALNEALVQLRFKRDYHDESQMKKAILYAGLAKEDVGRISKAEVAGLLQRVSRYILSSYSFGDSAFYLGRAHPLSKAFLRALKVFGVKEEDFFSRSGSWGNFIAVN